MAKFKKINFKSKSLWKKIGLGVLAGVVLIGAVFGVTALFRKAEEETQKEISPTWAIGGLTEQGAYLETKESIYTKDAFECYGLNIKMDFDNNISYRIFFYDYNDEFVGLTEKLTTNYSEDIDILVKSARIVITPNEDSKISWYEKIGYAKQLTISVDKNQSDTLANALPSDCKIFATMEKQNLTIFGKGLVSDGGISGSILKLVKSDTQTNFWYNEIDLTDYDFICVKYLASSYNNGEIVEFYKTNVTVNEKYNPSEISHFVSGDYVYVICETISASGSYWLHTNTSSLSCNLFEIYA